jgi:transcriptional regulator with XRE-family HTH domain
MPRPIGHETRIELTIRGEAAAAVRHGGLWEIVPARLAVSKKNVYQHLKDLRNDVRKANAAHRAQRKDGIRSAIATAMTDQAVSQSELARRAEVNPSRICDYLAGRRDLTGATLDRLCAALGLLLNRSVQRFVFTFTRDQHICFELTAGDTNQTAFYGHGAGMLRIVFAEFSGLELGLITVVVDIEVTGGGRLDPFSLDELTAAFRKN